MQKEDRERGNNQQSAILHKLLNRLILNILIQKEKNTYWNSNILFKQLYPIYDVN